MLVVVDIISDSMVEMAENEAMQRLWLSPENLAYYGSTKSLIDGRYYLEGYQGDEIIYDDYWCRR